MLFQSSIRLELARSFGAVLVVLVTVVMTMTPIRTLGLASRGNLNPTDVTQIMGYTVLAYMPTLLSMSLFIAIISTLSRMYRDSEMVIWFCSGKGPVALLRPLLRFAWPVFAVIALLALLVLPWSNQRIEDLKAQYERRGDLERIEPGQFQESGNGSRVFFVEKNAQGQESGANVFIATTERGRQTVTSARRGRIESTPQGQYLMLDNGQRLERVIGTPELKLSRFEHYATRVSEDPGVSAPSVPVNTLPTTRLLQNPDLAALGELSWRLGLLLAAVNLVVIGVLVSNVNPRLNKNINLVFALLTFVTYFNVLNLGQNWIASGSVSFAALMLGLHAGVFGLALLGLARTHHNWHLSHWFKPSVAPRRASAESA